MGVKLLLQGLEVGIVTTNLEPMLAFATCSGFHCRATWPSPAGP